MGFVLLYLSVDLLAMWQLLGFLWRLLLYLSLNRLLSPVIMSSVIAFEGFLTPCSFNHEAFAVNNRSIVWVMKCFGRYYVTLCYTMFYYVLLCLNACFSCSYNSIVQLQCSPGSQAKQEVVTASIILWMHNDFGNKLAVGKCIIGILHQYDMHCMIFFTWGCCIVIIILFLTLKVS